MHRKFAFLLLLVFAAPLVAQETLTVVTWNIESGDADANVIADRIKTAQGVDIWGFTEVQGAAVIPTLESAAEDGENADYQSILGTTGGGDRMLIIYDADRLELVSQEELDEINIGGNVRAPLVAQFQDVITGQGFFFMVNHLYRSRKDRRHQQSRLLNEWASEQDSPVIAVGDYNYDWEVEGGDNDHDAGFDLLTAANIFIWIRPETLRRTQCSATSSGGCRFNSVLDFVFAANLPDSWRASSEILVTPGDFPDDSSTPDHRPVQAAFDISPPTTISIEELKAKLLARIAALEAEIAALRAIVEEL